MFINRKTLESDLAAKSYSFSDLFFTYFKNNESFHVSTLNFLVDKQIFGQLFIFTRLIKFTIKRVKSYFGDSRRHRHTHFSYAQVCIHKLCGWGNYPFSELMSEIQII